MQFCAFGNDGSAPFELTRKHPHPAMPRDLPDEIADLWRELGRDESLHPALQARMADLMWARKDRTPGIRWFEVAVDTNIRLSQRDDWHILDRCMGLRRAVTVAAETHREDLMDRCESAAQRTIRSSLAQGDGQFGIVHPLLAALVGHERDIGDLLDEAIDVYRADPENHNSLLDLMASARPDESADVAQRQIGAFEQRAMSESGFRQLHFLRRAVDVAHEHDDQEAVARLLAKIERADLSADLHSATVEEDIEAADVDAFAQQFAVGGGLVAELAAWSSCCPLEEESEARAGAQAMIDQYLHLQLVTQVVYDEHGTVREIHPGTEEQLKYVMHQNDSVQLQMFGGLWGRESLRSIIERNADELDDFESLVQRPWIDSDQASRTSAALLRWQCGKLDQNDVRLLTLCIEPIIRSLLKIIGIRTTQLAPRGKSGNIEPLALGGMLSAWQDLPPRWGRYLRLALLDTDALRIRNSIGHGTDSEMNSAEAFVVVFHILGFLGFNTLKPIEQTSNT